MGALDDAIREHLELKRRHGASDEEIQQAEAEALGPARRGPAGDAVDPVGADEPDGGFHDDDPAPLAGAYAAGDAPPMPSDAAIDAPPPPVAFEAAADAPAPPPLDEPAAFAEPLDDVALEPERLEPEAPEPEALEPLEPLEPVEPDPIDLPHAHDPDRNRTAILDEPLEDLPPIDEPPLDQPPLHHEPGPDEPPAPARPPQADPLEPPTAERPAAPAPASDPADPDPADEDVLEETPDFLQETPEHDRLWFEQKPPRDFDFDD
jgi:hypothetical protein